MLLVNNLASRIDAAKSSLSEAISQVLSSGWLVLGPYVRQFEESFADYLGAGYCVSLANGTDAIELALKALDVSRGDCVATVSNAGMYTSTALLAIGAEPLYMDVDIESRNVTLLEVSRAIEAGAKAVVVTHLYGLAVTEIQEIATLCKSQNVRLLEDCAQAHGAKVSGRCAGTFGDAASFSFYPTKNLGALGDGGAVVTNNPEIAERVSRLRQYGWISKYKVELAGSRNSRLDEIQASILSMFLPGLDAANARRREIATQYSQAIRHPDVQVPAVYAENYVAHLYVARSARRDSLRAHLLSCGIGTDVHYPIPDYKQPIFHKQFSNLSLVNTERLSAEVLTLPCYPEMTDEQVEQVIHAVIRWNADF